jgi:hypothetical protein
MNIKRVRKRDGRIVKFDQEKIVTAITKAMTSVKEGNLNEDPIRIAEKVVQELEKRSFSQGIPDIEEIQDIVEEKLILTDLPKTTKAYILYRQERAKIREKQQAVPERVKKLVKESKKYFSDELGELIYYRTYSRWLSEEKRRETWIETVDRYIAFMKKKIGNKLSEIKYNEIKQAILNQEVMPSMRLMWTAGEAAEATNVAIYNCAYMAPKNLNDFAEIMYLLMCGTGVGFSVENRNVQRLPIVKTQDGQDVPIHVIGDSKEGWGEALTLGLEAWYEGRDIEFDYSQIRSSGTRLKTMGGISSGPAPLKSLLTFVKKTVLNNQGRRLSSVGVYDIICKIGQLVEMGGVRRSALISLSNLEDENMRRAKTGFYYISHPQRSMANNSVVYDKKPTTTEFMEEWLSLAKSGTGERGIFNRGGLKEQMPERRWEKFKEHWQSSGTNPCVTSDTLVYTADGRGNVSIKQLAEENKDVPVFCYAADGKIAIRYMRNPRVTGFNQPIYKVKLDDGSAIKVTANHKFRLASGEYKKTENLQPGDSLAILTRFEASIKDIFSEVNSRSQDYWWVNNGKGNNVAEHRLIAGFHYNTKIPEGHVVHHRDRNAQNNYPNNLEIMTKQEHDTLHSKLMIGNANPMRRAKNEWDEEKWTQYRLKHSKNNAGSKNKNFSGISNEELKTHALKLTKTLGCRFSNKDWIEYAKRNNLPQSFSKWRQDHLGGIIGLAKWAALELGFDYIDANPRTIKAYKKYTSEGYNCEIIDGQLLIIKNCEVCGKEFKVSPQRREYGVCSISCGLKRAWSNPSFKTDIIKRINKAHQERKEKIRVAQTKVYSDLKFKLRRNPLKKEWVEACRENNVSCEIARASSPFRQYEQLKEFAETYNHKVVSVEFVGYEDVYNGTVDEFHNFFVGAFNSRTRANKRKFVYLNNLQCGEITLRDNEFCNLTEIVARPNDTEETLMKKAELATILGTYQASLTDFPFISKKWKENCEEERLLGVSITGQWDSPAVRNPECLKKIYKKVLETNKEYAKKLNINPSLSVTSIKPSGTVSLLVNAAPGMHPRHSPYYIRRVRISAEDPLCKMLKEQKVPYHPEVGQTEESATTFVFDFPIKAPEKSVFKKDLDAITQIQYWRTVKENYTEHNPSVTILVGDEEWLKVANWVYENWNIIGGLTFLPRDETVYQLAPFEEISEQEYEKLIEDFPKTDYSHILTYEREKGGDG